MGQHPSYLYPSRRCKLHPLTSTLGHLEKNSHPPGQHGRGFRTAISASRTVGTSSSIARVLWVSSQRSRDVSPSERRQPKGNTLEPLTLTRSHFRDISADPRLVSVHGRGKSGEAPQEHMHPLSCPPIQPLPPFSPIAAPCVSKGTGGLANVFSGPSRRMFAPDINYAKAKVEPLPTGRAGRLFKVAHFRVK